MPRGSGVTRADAIFERIRLDILNGGLAPGSKLAFADMGARYGASTGVLREVLPRLVEQGLATSESQLGYRVKTASAEDLAALTEARVAIEPLVAKRAVEVGDLAWESEVVAAHHALAKTQHFETNSDGVVAATSEWIYRHEQFHVTLLRGCGNEHLLELAVRLRAIAEVYRYWTAEEVERVHRDIAGEHRAIHDAAVRRDADLCARLIAQHIRVTTDNMLASRPALGLDDLEVKAPA